jgi:DNA-binding XRE family transcriptional regulator
MLINMTYKPINRIKVVLVENSKTNKWLAKELKMNETTISRWCTNSTQPSIETLVQVARLLNVDIKELLSSTKD